MAMSDVGLTRLAVPISDEDHVQGPDTAPATLLEYGDYECPYCGMAFAIVKRVQASMGEQLRFAFRNFPIVEAHPHAEHAAEAAEAAGAQGAFWDMHDELYSHQDALDDRHLILYAAELGLDVDRFTRELSGHAHHHKIERDVQSGIESGVQGTPTFFINGIRYDGSWDFEDLLAACIAAAEIG